jgi:catecholate siderophore receptor
LVNEYRFSPDSQLRTQLRLADYERSYWARTPSLTSPPNPQALVLNGSVANGGPTRTADYETVTCNRTTAPPSVPGHGASELLTGVEYLNENSYRTTLRNLGGTTAGNPPYYRPYDPNPPAAPVNFDSDSYAFYAQDTVEFIPQWKFTLGVRRDEMDADYSSQPPRPLDYGENSYRSALSFHPTTENHYYLSWSDSFSPTADLYQLTVTPLPAERSEVVELGSQMALVRG